jgi:O-antigen/teichoic acid export membrane protein
LELSDRVILEHMVSIAELGVYSLGYQLGSAITMLSTAFNSAWIPHLFGYLQRGEEGADERVARLTTYFIVGLVFAALGWALLLPDLLRLVVTPAFFPATRIALWVIGAGVLGGLYLVPVGLLFWSKATRWVPLATIAAGATNIGLNLLLVPRYGSIAAAISTLVANAVLLVVVAFVAQRIHPLPYEYRRLGIAVGGALALFAAWGILPLGPGAARAAVAFLLWIAYPLVLVGLGFFRAGETAWITGTLRARGVR